MGDGGAVPCAAMDRFDSGSTGGNRTIAGRLSLWLTTARSTTAEAPWTSGTACCGRFTAQPVAISARSAQTTATRLDRRLTTHFPSKRVPAKMFRVLAAERWIGADTQPQHRTDDLKGYTESNDAADFHGGPRVSNGRAVDLRVDLRTTCGATSGAIRSQCVPLCASELH